VLSAAIAVTEHRSQLLRKHPWPRSLRTRLKRKLLAPRTSVKMRVGQVTFAVLRIVPARRS
jgi:hypothetical protein